MRRIAVISGLLSMTMISSAQVLVDSNGKMAVGIDVNSYNTTYSRFSVNTRGDNNTLSSFNSNGYSTGIRIDQSAQNSSTSSTRYGLDVYADNISNKTIYGIRTMTMAGSSTPGCTSYGLWSMAGRGESGKTYGICTSILYGNNGAGIFASDGSNSYGVTLSDRWAGYFDGKVKVTQSINCPVFSTGSDYRLKENIRSLSSGSLDRVMEMNVIQYNLKQFEVESNDTTSEKHYLYDPESEVFKNTHYGLIAQELQELYPDLVLKGGDGFLSVNYMELIPILIKSIQELKTQLDAVTDPVRHAQTKGDINMTSPVTGLETQLFQNTPNPFTENTTIECVVGNDVKNASLYIYDMNGRQIDVLPVEGRGNTAVTIEGRSLEAGIYLYSLIADGQVIETKRMILTR